MLGRKPVATDWQPSSCAQPIRDALHAEQQGLCGYCMRRVSVAAHLDVPAPNGNGGMRIEHVIPRSSAPGMMYDWNNLLGVCGGQTTASDARVYKHCDRSRGNRSLTLSPFIGVPLPDDAIVYRPGPRGIEVLPAETLDEATRKSVAKDIETLGLNASSLCEFRQKARKALADGIQKAESRGRRAQFIRNQLSRVNGSQPGADAEEFPVMCAQYLAQKARS